MNRRTCLSSLLLVGAALAQSADPPTPSAPRADEARSAQLQRTARAVFDRVLHAEPDANGVAWSCGTTWKASFGRGGFTYVPAFAPDAPRNFPVQFRVARVAVGGAALDVVPAVLPERRGDRVQFARGALTERYDLRLDAVEQSFVVDTAAPGDVELVLAVATELREDGARAGVQFGNEWGEVVYGDAFLVRDREQLPLTTRWSAGELRIHVPAALRGDGPVVIDPVITTVTSAFGSAGQPVNLPDISYDATQQLFLAVWERPWSATDCDLLSQYFTDTGLVLPNSGAVVEIGAEHSRGPRVANLNWVDRFLIVYEHTDPFQFGGRTMIGARVRQAGGARLVGSPLVVSDPSDVGHAATPDVGGDASPLPGGLGWAVVWTQVTSAGGKIMRRLVAPNGAMATAANALGPQTTDTQYSPQISQSSGVGVVTDPHWLVVCSSIVLGSNVDVAAFTIAPNGAIGGRMNIATSNDQDWYPFVSSPATDATGAEAWYMITWERQGLQSRSFAAIYNHRTQTATAPFDLTNVGIGAYWARAESDGLRFVVAASLDVHTNDIALATVAWNGSFLESHESPVVFSSAASFPHVVAARNGGGPDTSYAVVYVESSVNPAVVAVTRYRGHQPGPMVVVRPLACHGLTISFAGQPLLGGHVDLGMWPGPNEVPAMLIGFPAVTPLVLCPGCALGLRLDLPIAAHLSHNVRFQIPADTRLVGVTFAAQGVSIGDASCLAGLHTTELLELTIR